MGGVLFVGFENVEALFSPGLGQLVYGFEDRALEIKLNADAVEVEKRFGDGSIHIEDDGFYFHLHVNRRAAPARPTIRVGGVRWPIDKIPLLNFYYFMV